MTTILLEADRLTVDLRSIYNNAKKAEIDNSEDEIDAANTQSGYLSDESIATILEQKNVDADTAKKIIALGDALKKAIKVLGTETEPKNGSNPLLAFLIQPYVQKELINSGLLNAITFKAIYNALAKKLVVDSEFFARQKQNDYNIIYCKDLYKKTLSEIEEYLALQAKILTLSSSVYPVETQVENKKVFIQLKGIKNENTGEEELEPSKRAKIIVSSQVKAKSVTDTDAKLNDIKLAKLIAGVSDFTNEKTLNDKAQDKIITDLQQLSANYISTVYATILSLNLNTTSTKIEAILQDKVFTSVNSDEVLDAVKKLASSTILPKGQLAAKDAEALAEKLLASLEQESNK